MDEVIRIGVISDTHFSDVSRGMAFMQEMFTGPFRGIDMLLHAGDLVKDEILAAVTDCPVYAVRGNMDRHSALPFKRIMEAGGHRIGLIHGWGAPAGLEKRLLHEFENEQIGILVYGHSHQPMCLEHQGVLLFNPGSATDRRDAPSHTVGILELSGSIRGRIVNLD